MFEDRAPLARTFVGDDGDAGRATGADLWRTPMSRSRWAVAWAGRQRRHVVHLTAIGNDNRGNLIGFTSAHCGGPGAQVGAEGAEANVFGTVAGNDALDYAVIQFDPAKVTPVNNVDGFQIDGSGPTRGRRGRVQARPDDRLVWRRLGTRPGAGHDRQPGVRQPGDSGAPVTVNNRLVGMIHGAFAEELPTCIIKYIPLHTPAVAMSINTQLADIVAKNRPGSGFVPVGHQRVAATCWPGSPRTRMGRPASTCRRVRPSATSRSSRRMILPLRVLELGHDVNLARTRDLSDLLRHLLAQFVDHVVVVLGLRLQDDEGADALAGGLIGRADNGCLGNAGMTDQCRLDLCRRDPVARHVHHVVDAAEQPDVAVGVDARPVAGEIPTSAYRDQ